MKSGPEIQASLKTLAARWADYSGSEKGEAQTFLNDLFLCYGADRLAVGAKFEHFNSQAGFMDLYWPGLCIIEMKRPGTVLSLARAQAMRYREESADPANDVPAARFVVLCSFQAFEIWEPGNYPKAPRMSLTLAELAQQPQALAFLAGPNVEPSFVEQHGALTTTAAKQIAVLYESLITRSAAPADEIQQLVMQAVWCLFAEDIGMLSGRPLQATAQRVLKGSGLSAEAEFGLLFRLLNRKSGHNRTDHLSGTTYVNGGLFRDPASIELTRLEVSMLFEASKFDWTMVDPTIFGSLLEGLLGKERRYEIGAHYTHEVDIMKIVTPTIVRPWEERIAALTSPAQARELLDELCAFRILDPACGCGNFLYIAYREMRRLEHEIKERIGELAHDKGLSSPPKPWPYFPLTNLLGIDVEARAVAVARVVLWMGHRQMIERYGEAEDPLPLVNLSGIRRADALAVDWPDCDAIIGNPPFLGSQWLRGKLGDDYVKWLSTQFRVGIKDFCTYWFRKAAEHLQPGQRAGLVGTNSIAQNRARSASLQYVIDQGGVITDAVSSQKWPGEAKVHVSLVNWIDEPTDPPKPIILDAVEVAGIGPDLTESLIGDWVPVALPANAGRCFQGLMPVGEGFVLPNAVAASWLAESAVDYGDVLRPFLTGQDITDSADQTPSRFVIDFGVRPLEEAGHYPLALDRLRAQVRTERATNKDRYRRENWWRFGRPYTAVRTAMGGRARVAVMNQVGKRPLFVWIDPWVCPNSKINVFAFDDDFAMGLLTSRAHGAWAWHQGATLKGDLSYTPTSVFATFAWPDRATEVQRERVAEASRRLLARRSEVCLAEQIGLTTLYNRVDDGAYTDVAALHRALDEAVVDCYGWPKSIAQDDRELVRRLTDLNREIAEGGLPYTPFGYLKT